MNKVFIASDGVRFGSTAGGLAVITASGEHTLTAARVVADAVTGLNEQPLGLSEMSTNVLNGAGALKNFALLQGMVSQFTRMGLIAPAVMDDGRVLAKLLRKGQLDLVQEAPPAEFVLSRHVVATPDGEGMLLDSGTSGATVWVAADQLPLLFHSNLGAGPCQPIGQLLWQAGLGVREVEPSFPDRMWHPVELLATHIAIDSRAGRPYGGTYRFEAEVPAPGLTDGAVPVAEVIPYPEAADDWSTDPPYGEVVRARESRFDFTTGPAPTLAQVIGILRRTTTVREFLRGDRGLLATRRYVPSGGGLHEVDLYLAVRDVEGLAPGLYRNEPVDETLQRVETRIDPQVLIDVAGGSFSPPTTPSFVILFVARFDRLMW
ncbi:MAG: hypothetical protein Q4G46_12830, partial [Propionibacteriaceae bacterium]|nr:hypothetical protein [Propionibacteriaceae bacterium]